MIVLTFIGWLAAGASLYWWLKTKSKNAWIEDELRLVVGIAMGVMAVTVFFLWPKSQPTAEEIANSEAFDQEVQARKVCQTEIKKWSRDPDKTEIPYVIASSTQEFIGFIWGGNTPMLRMRNGFGNDVGVAAICVVYRSSGAIKSLILDGKTVV